MDGTFVSVKTERGIRYIEFALVFEKLEYILCFQTFVIGGPTSGTFTQDRGACITDTFTASSSAGAVPVICGTNTGQHSMYINIYLLTST